MINVVLRDGTKLKIGHDVINGHYRYYISLKSVSRLGWYHASLDKYTSHSSYVLINEGLRVIERAQHER